MVICVNYNNIYPRCAVRICPNGDFFASFTMLRIIVRGNKKIKLPSRSSTERAVLIFMLYKFNWSDVFVLYIF